MWQPKIKKMNWFVRTITFGWAAGITLAPFGIYIKEKYLNQSTIITHESIHWKQQLEMMVAGAIIALLAGVILLFNIFSWWLLTVLVFPFLFFYLWYLIEWIIRLFINGKKAYNCLSFEREANCYEYNETYLIVRKPYAWLRFMKE
jgi:hypothetical protein